MGTLNNAMYIGLSGLRANQMGLNVAGQNVSNVNTDGYTRQQMVLEANKPIRVNNIVFGTGVNLASITRSRSAFIDREFRDQNSQLGDLNKQSESLNLIEGIINEPSDNGLHNAIQNFFNSLQDLATNPESSSVRTTVREQGRALAQTFGLVGSQLQKIRDDKNFEISDAVSQINATLDGIGRLNAEIGKTESLGSQANDLRDSRDKLLDKLSGLVDMAAVEDSRTGSMTVSINGQAFVTQDSVQHLRADSRNVDGKEYVTVINPANNNDMHLSGGELAGILQVRDQILPDLQGRIDILAKSVIDNVNAVHRQGFGLQGNRSAPPTDIQFFDGTNAATMKLSFAIENDPGNIAASLNGEAGDNSNALALAQLRNARLLGNNSFTYEDYLAGLVSTFGLNTTDITNQLDNQQNLTDHLKNFRESQLGVNLDEELASMIRYQKAFGASARIITTVSDMMDISINLGRY